MLLLVSVTMSIAKDSQRSPEAGFMVTLPLRYLVSAYPINANVLSVRQSVACEKLHAT